MIDTLSILFHLILITYLLEIFYNVYHHSTDKETVQK